MATKWISKYFVALFLVLGFSGIAVSQMPNPYGPTITLDTARKLAVPPLTEAARNNWSVAVAIVGPSGELIYFEKMDNTQIASASVAIDKARSAAVFKRPTKAFEDALAAGGDGLRILGLPGAVPLEGGIPLVIDGRIVGAIGVSGATSAQDAQCAKAGVDVLKDMTTPKSRP
jgi:uncharacterized protein GlcG (DUF336 family)